MLAALALLAARVSDVATLRRAARAGLPANFSWREAVEWCSINVSANAG
jgi:hypothetical protein